MPTAAPPSPAFAEPPVALPALLTVPASLPEGDFSARVRALPVLGLGVSTEYGAAFARGALDLRRLRREHPAFAQFLEVGVETAKGLDAHTHEWVAEGRPTTYHFLDVNLDDPEDFTPAWLGDVRRIVSQIRPAWLCGDAGLWHFGRREPGTMLLLPPILTAESARAQAWGLTRLRAETGLEVLPENPPGQVFVGDLHILDFFARVCEHADTGLVLDCAHLTIYQHCKGLPPLAALDGFPLDRVVEIHVAGGREASVDGYAFIEDDHTPEVLPATWEILEYVVPRAPNLRAVIFECERNPVDACLPGFARIAEILKSSPLIGGSA
jgi:uncharacterized protein (UPF0276 family)